MKIRVSQSGVALLQVLLICMVISLIALQFARTSQGQIAMAKQFEDRVAAQLLASSTINEVMFAQLSYSVSGVSSSKVSMTELKQRINLHGSPIVWRDDVSVSVQDLNGLLPQIYPRHILWRYLLERGGMDQKRIENYLGTWQDLQDPDVDSWRIGDVEPVALNSGERYLDGYAQTEHPIQWIFQDDQDLLKLLLDVSDVKSSFDTNIFNSPDVLIDALFQPSIATEIKNARNNPAIERLNITGLLPKDLKVDNIYQHNSAVRKITVSVINENSSWKEEWRVMLSASQDPPFRILSKR